jgi:hypothetical protein
MRFFCLSRLSLLLHTYHYPPSLPLSTSINPAYVLGSFLTPISWGMHVAAWIQKQNGK